tara:strand:- start:214 stop:426 length:213 start_codon:yes stop_codon:yes gene_type:complete
MDGYERVPLRNGLYLYIKLNAPRYKFATPKVIKAINKYLLNSARIMRKREEYLRKQPSQKPTQRRNDPSR